MKLLLGMLRALLYFTLFAALVGLVAGVTLYYRLAPEVPDSAGLRDVELQVPLRVFTHDDRLIAEFGEMRRIPVRYEQIPTILVQAFLAAEDDRFFEHPGVDYQGILRAGWLYATTGERRQGGSTITMQVARNFFLSREKTFTRKLNEILLALKIERELSKEEILTLYLNKIYLGQRAYGIAAAAQVYYGSSLEDLSLAQAAMIAGLPKAPSVSNPISSPDRAKIRRDYVLQRMLDLRYIQRSEYQAARTAPLSARLHSTPVEVSAPYVAEMVRQELREVFGEEIYTRGLSAYTTIEGDTQAAANEALVRALLDYDRRHGWRGAEAQLEIAVDEAELRRALADRGVFAGLVPAVVTQVTAKDVELLIQDGERTRLGLEAMRWAAPYRNENSVGAEPKVPGDVLEVGDVVRLRNTGEGMELAQLPDIQGALIALDPRSGGIRALVGGFDFQASKFNRVTQAKRQPGSNFKPFLYASALDHGYTPATLVNDAPIVMEDIREGEDWRPQNFSRKFYGPTRLREALYRSRNLVSIRILRDLGIDYVRDYVTRFGFDPDALPPNLTMALGSATLTPLQLAEGYAVFANGGYRVRSYLVDKVEDAHGKALIAAQPTHAPGVDVAGPDAPRVLAEDTAYIMRDMLADVIRRGTATKAKSLGRDDLAGKTGTTNDQMDAWFSGFNTEVVATTWVGFDELRSLGNREVGGVAALPMWMYLMEDILQGVPEGEPPVPAGIVTARIDPRTGLRVTDGASANDSVVEVFRAGQLPAASAPSGGSGEDGAGSGAPSAEGGALF
jgi:penicillin-binding protein 1A